MKKKIKIKVGPDEADEFAKRFKQREAFIAKDKAWEEGVKALAKKLGVKDFISAAIYDHPEAGGQPKSFGMLSSFHGNCGMQCYLSKALEDQIIRTSRG